MVVKYLIMGFSTNYKTAQINKKCALIIDVQIGLGTEITARSVKLILTLAIRRILLAFKSLYSLYWFDNEYNI